MLSKHSLKNWLSLLFLLVALRPLAAKNRLTIINATGYDSNLENVSPPNYPALANDMKILSGKQFKPTKNLSWGLGGGISASYRGAGEPKNAGVWQLQPKVNLNSRYNPDFLNPYNFKFGLDLFYSHKFHPYFRNSAVDDGTNILNLTEDDGSYTFDQGFSSAGETADADVDDDFEDPDFVGQGSGQSYTVLKSFARGTYINNYTGKFSSFITPYGDWEFRLSAIATHSDVGEVPGTQPATSTAHAYEIGATREILNRLDLTVSYQVEFRKFPGRYAFVGSTETFFVRTQQIPAELSVNLGRRMRVIGGYAWIYREVPLNNIYDTFLNIAYSEFVVRLSKDFGFSIWGGYALTKFTASESPDVNRGVFGLAAVYNFSYQPLTPLGL